MKKLVLSVLVVVALVMTSCGKAKEAADKTADAAKEAVEKTGDAVKNAADKTADAAKEAVEKTGEAVKEGAEAVKEGAEKVADAVSPKVAKGKKLFTEKTCATCHAPDKKVVGPAIKDIAAKYAEKNANIVQFLKGKADAIVDTNPGQVAVMKANIDGILKDVSAEDMQAIAAYIRSVK